MRDRSSAAGERLLAAGKYAAAGRAFAVSLKNDPNNPSVLLRIADCAFLDSNPRGAAKAARRAYAVLAHPDLLRRCLQASLLADDERSAVSLLKSLPKNDGEALFWRAVLACRAKSWKNARRLFLAAVVADPERLASRAGLLAAWAGHRAAGAPPAPKGRGVVVVGLGWKRPRQATVGGLDALASCDALFVVANTVDDEVRDVLCLFRATVRPVVFRGSEAEAAAAAARALKAARAGRAGTVTRGNPLVYGRFAARLVAGCDAAGIPVEVLPGVSAFEGLAAEARPAPSSPLGLELRGGFTAADADPRRPLVIFAPSAARGRGRLADALPRVAGGAPVSVLTSEGPSAAASSRLSAREAAAALRASSTPAMLWLPSRRPSK